MKHFLLLAMIMLAALCASAQEMRVLSMRMESMDLTAATHQRLDLNGVPCAVVKVQMPEGAPFGGSIIEPVEYRTGEYWVYMPANSKALRVKHGSAKPLQVSFSDHGVPPLQSKATYVLDVAMPAAQSATTQQKVEIRFSPADAIVLINNQPAKVFGNTATATLPADRDYSYIVTGNGYIAQHGTFHLHPAVPTHLNIELMPDPAAQLAPAPQRSESDILAEADREFDNKNYTRAMELYMQIPDNNEAQHQIGKMYYDGKGVSQNYTEAMNWFRKAAERGYAKSQNNVGAMYYEGSGVNQNYAEAVNWYRKAAEQGLATAQYNLGVRYEYGQGVSQNYSEAEKWYRKAAEQGYAPAQCNLGTCYSQGRGISQDYAEALKWFRKAVEQGDARAQCLLGICYYNGNGVDVDKKEAYRWIKMSADQGYEYAIKVLEEHTF